MSYVIVDTHTGRVAGKAKTLAGARRGADRRDNAYGAYRYRAETAERYQQRQEERAAAILKADLESLIRETLGHAREMPAHIV